jgi:hypothetical protein
LPSSTKAEISWACSQHDAQVAGIDHLGELVGQIAEERGPCLGGRLLTPETIDVRLRGGCLVGELGVCLCNTRTPDRRRVWIEP